MERIAIIADNSIEFVGTLLKAWNSDKVAVLIDYRTSCAACLELLTEANVSEVYTDRQDLLDYLAQVVNSEFDVKVMNNDNCVNEIPNEIRNLYKKRYDDKEAIILFSSGTTGNCKGIRLSHSAIVMNAERIAERKGINSESSLYIYKTFAHCASFIGELMVGLVSGAKIYICSTKSMIRMHLENIAKYSITHISVNPTVIQMLIKTTKKYDFSRLKLVSCSGALLSERCFEEAHNFFGCDIVNMYGMTEAASLFSCQICKSGKLNMLEEFESVGFPLVGNRVRIWNCEANCEAKVREIGEIHIISTTLMMGYLGKEGPDCDDEGFWHTGDMGFVSETGELYVVGRKDRMIISCGHNVFPEYIERIIKNTGYVEECIVTGISDNMYGEKICCMYIEKKGQKNIEGQLRKICMEQLAQYEVPHYFRKCEQFAYTNSGKILRYERAT